MTLPIRRIAILGATGTIGTATLQVIEHLQQLEANHWTIAGISGHHNVAGLATIAHRHQPAIVVVSCQESASKWQANNIDPSTAFSGECRFAIGADELIALAQDPDVDTVVAAIVGRAGLESTLAAIRAGKRVALANKETLVVAGQIVRELLAETKAELLPVDSEHAAIFQCLLGRQKPRRLILTASGGPFRDWTVAQMQAATVTQALAHPTWRMGRKITIDSATMMNKALEIIEARWLFDVTAEQVAVVIHPQSIIHSLVETVDGSVLAQMSPPDMRLPIQQALTHPDCVPGTTATMNFSQTYGLTLLPVDTDRFPAILLGFEVAKVGGTAGAVVNAANEEAVELFLNGKLRFTEIVPACQNALAQHNHEQSATVERLLELDRWARAEVRRWQARLH